MAIIPKPQEGEYAPYTLAYISLVPDEVNVLELLEDNLELMKDLVYSLPDEKLTTPHAEGEWTVHEILVHIMDTERVFAYRALRVARGDKTPMPGFEQDDYVAPSRANERSLHSIFEEYTAIREATLTLLHSFHEDVYENMGTASNNPITVRALMYIIAGHEMHHLVSIRENYLS